MHVYILQRIFGRHVRQRGTLRRDVLVMKHSGPCLCCRLHREDQDGKNKHGGVTGVEGQSARWLVPGEHPGFGKTLLRATGRAIMRARETKGHEIVPNAHNRRFHFLFHSLARASLSSAHQGSGFRVQGSGFRVQGSGFRVQGSGFRVQGFLSSADLFWVRKRRKSAACCCVHMPSTTASKAPKTPARAT